MLGKLIKYEFQAVSRFLLPLHLALIGITLIGRLYVQFALTNMDSRFDLIHVSLVMFYVLALVAIFVVTYVYLYILRPHRNWFSDEGYLMHTLPVTAAQHIFSKLLVAMCWILLDLFLLGLSLFCMLINPDVWSSWPDFVSMMQEMITIVTGMDFLVGAVAFVLNFLIDCARGLLVIYMCLAIGHSFNQYKLLISIAIYIGVYVGSSLITTLGSILIGFNHNTSSSILNLFIISNSSISNSSAMTWFDTLFSLAVAVGAFLITRYFLTRRLNLE